MRDTILVAQILFLTLASWRLVQSSRVLLSARGQRPTPELVDSQHKARGRLIIVLAMCCLIASTMATSNAIVAGILLLMAVAGVVLYMKYRRMHRVS